MSEIKLTERGKALVEKRKAERADNIARNGHYVEPQWFRGYMSEDWKNDNPVVDNGQEEEPFNIKEYEERLKNKKSKPKASVKDKRSEFAAESVVIEDGAEDDDTEDDEDEEYEN